jgi:hypothetical protein
MVGIFLLLGLATGCGHEMCVNGTCGGGGGTYDVPASRDRDAVSEDTADGNVTSEDTADGTGATEASTDAPE